MTSFCQRITRRKHAQDLPQGDIPLHRCLTTFDLTLLGIGSMVGSGIYIMTGVAAKELAGPAMFVSFLVAAVAICLVAACFLEFAGRVRRTGSAYVFMYVSLGELPAFILGNGLLVGLTLGAATNGRAWSAYLDFLLGGRIANLTEKYVAHWDVGPPLAEYPDVLAATIIAVLTVVVTAGAQCSARFNTTFAAMNIATLVFVIVVGFIYADVTNWTSQETGGFTPYGWSGILAGSGAAFWAFMGFEVLCVCTEETKEPKKSIPRATALAVLIVAVLYMGVAASITLVSSYRNIDTKAPLPSAFAARGITWAMYVVSVGPLFGLTTTLLTSVFAAVRLGYAMADDGLLPAVFAWISPSRKVPVVTSLTIGCLMCVTSLCLELRDLLGFAVVLALMQYIFIAVAVIIQRYRPLARRPQHVHEQEDNETWERDIHETQDDETPPNSAQEPLLRSRGPRSSPLSSSSLSDSEGYDPSLDIRTTPYPANQGPGERPRDGHVVGCRTTFLSEDLAGDGFTTTEDEMVLFDVRKIPPAPSQNASRNNAASIKPTDLERSAKQRLNNNAASSDDCDQSSSDGSNRKDSSRLMGNGTGGMSTASEVRAGHLKMRYAFLRPCFRPCEGSWVLIACILVVLSTGVISAMVFLGQQQESIPDLGNSTSSPKSSLQQDENTTAGNTTGGLPVQRDHGQGRGHTWWAIVLMCLGTVITCLLVISIWMHQQSRQELTFKVRNKRVALVIPCVPVVPSLTILVCSLLLFGNATPFSWIGCAFVLLFSLVIYFSYSIRHSKLDAGWAGIKSRRQAPPGDDTARLLEQEESEDEL